MPIVDKKIAAFAKDVSDLVDKPTGMSAAQIKEQFDAAPNELRVALNGLIDILLSATVGDSGAENIGSPVIVGVTGDTVYEQLSDLKAQINSAITGALPDGSINTAKYQDGSVTPLKLSFVPVQSTDVETTATANKLLKLDANGKLPASITGDAATVAGFVPARSTSGSYTGDGAVNRFINLGFAPKFVGISCTMATNQAMATISLATNAAGRFSAGGASDTNNTVSAGEKSRIEVPECVADGFYVSSGSAYGPNTAGNVYHYVAIG